MPSSANPSDDAASQLIWLAMQSIIADGGSANRDWKEAMNQFWPPGI